ncbi:unnamed protein product [Thelazia callipaeda]|uniref:Secreted protein n=1 Tax=Thelazia callipaeda TaxID=103827 RepID=A0A0N5D7E5_THECL|nr:unnamed protein product [Thelazia callipaeda]
MVPLYTSNNWICVLTFFNFCHHCCHYRSKKMLEKCIPAIIFCVETQEMRICKKYSSEGRNKQNQEDTATSFCILLIELILFVKFQINQQNLTQEIAIQTNGIVYTSDRYPRSGHSVNSQFIQTCTTTRSAISTAC